MCVDLDGHHKRFEKLRTFAVEVVRPAVCCLVKFTLLNEKASGSLAEAEDKERCVRLVFTSLGSLGCVHLAHLK